MDTNDKIIDICRRELEYGCYDCKANGFSLYLLIRRDVRDRALAKMGEPFMQTRSKINIINVIPSAFKSLYHLFLLCIREKHYSIVFNSFPRTEKVQDFFIDKFTDPIILESGLNETFIIFNHGRAGKHLKPRLNQDKIVYTDALFIIAKMVSIILFPYYNRKYRKEFEKTYSAISQAFGAVISKKEIYKRFCVGFCMIWLLKKIFMKICAKVVVGPARDYQTVYFIAAHLLGLKVFELQHGITYGETTMYSGFRDPMMMPDYFLAFGDNKPINVYGIEESRIVNIGWALQDYISKLPSKGNYGENNILVVSDPEITDAIIEVVLKLAQDNIDRIFYIRPHPHEVINAEQMKKIETRNNVKIQDKSINITIVLSGFNHVIGENSTVLYEALAIHKKVGRLFYKGLNPKYLEESDKECFWEIYNQNDFMRFLNDDISTKKSKCIYSPFNKELFLKTIGL